MLASVLQAASSELLKTKASEAFVHLVSSRRANSLVLYHYKSRFYARRRVPWITSQKQNAEPHPHPTPRRRGAKKPRTGLRHRPEKGGEGATPGRRASRVASAPNPRTEAIAHFLRSTSASAGPSTARTTRRACRWRSRSASPPSSGPTTTRSSRSLVEGSRGVINTQ